MNVWEAKELILSWNNIFLTWKAGTGKTTLMREIVDIIGRNKTMICSTTWLSAMNIGWVTVHSAFQMYWDYTERRGIATSLRDWSLIKLIVIDEVSMLLPSYLDYIDKFLQKNLKKKEPFGWIQVLLLWDLAQLLPIVRDEDEVQRHMALYKWITVDLADSFQHFTTCELTTVYRQTGKLLDIINEVRVGNLSNISHLNHSYGTKLSTHIMPYNNMVDKKNMMELSKLTTPIRKYQCKITWEFDTKNVTTPEELILKVWARVMVTKNTKPLVNGDQWTILRLESDFVIVYIDRLKKDIAIHTEVWENKKYTRGKWDAVLGTFTQIPLRLWWAMTIHKSQWMSIADLVVHYPQSMDSRLLYVALSRATNEDTLYIHKI